MPDQPDDPIHYDMKIPPEPQDAPLNKQRDQQGEPERGSDQVTDESNRIESHRGSDSEQPTKGSK